MSGTPPPVPDAAAARGLRLGIVASAFNGEVTRRLLEGARAALRELEVGEGAAEVVWVPGAFELPLAARVAAESGRFDAVACLGAVIRGETAHFDLVAGEAARGIQRVALDTGVPVLFGVLTTDTLEQALDRAGGSHGNKGWDCVMAAVQMVRAVAELGGGPVPAGGRPIEGGIR